MCPTVFQVEVVVVIVVVLLLIFDYYCCFCPSGRHGQRILEGTCGMRRLTYIGDFHIEAPPRCFGLKDGFINCCLLALAFLLGRKISYDMFSLFLLGCFGKWCLLALAF